MGTMKHNWNADDYANNSLSQLQRAEELITKPGLKGCESALDTGCGDGKTSARLAQVVRNGYVLGIDSFEDMIRKLPFRFLALTTSLG